MISNLNLLYPVDNLKAGRRALLTSIDENKNRKKEWLVTYFLKPDRLGFEPYIWHFMAATKQCVFRLH